MGCQRRVRPKASGRVRQGTVPSCLGVNADRFAAASILGAQSGATANGNACAPNGREFRRSDFGAVRPGWGEATAGLRAAAERREWRNSAATAARRRPRTGGCELVRSANRCAGLDRAAASIYRLVARGETAAVGDSEAVGRRRAHRGPVPAAKRGVSRGLAADEYSCLLRPHYRHGQSLGGSHAVHALGVRPERGRAFGYSQPHAASMGSFFYFRAIENWRSNNERLHGCGIVLMPGYAKTGHDFWRN